MASISRRAKQARNQIAKTIDKYGQVMKRTRPAHMDSNGDWQAEDVLFYKGRKSRASQNSSNWTDTGGDSEATRNEHSVLFGYNCDLSAGDMLSFSEWNWRITLKDPEMFGDYVIAWTCFLSRETRTE